MTPRAALENEIFRGYVLLVACLLLIAGIVLMLLRWRLGGKTDHAWKAYQAWLFMIPLIVVVMFLGREAFIVFVTILSLRGFWEFATATGLARDRWLVVVVAAGFVGLGVAALVTEPEQNTPGWYGLYLTLPVYVIVLIFLVPILRNSSTGQVRQGSLAVLGFMYIGWLFGFLALLANVRQAYAYLSFLLFAVEACDIAAYICGRIFGRHPLRSEISPKKTWEGALGSLALAMSLPWLLRFTFPHFGAVELLLTGLIVGIGGQVGDLSMSVIKRDVDVKDMGQVIPGHGGILDRIDSLILVAPLFFQMVHFFHNLY